MADILKISKSIKLLVKMKNVSYFTEKKHVDFLANPILRREKRLSYSPLYPHGPQTMSGMWEKMQVFLEELNEIKIPVACKINHWRSQE